MKKGWAIAAVLICSLFGGAVQAQYFKQPESDVDPKIFLIDEKKYLGAQLEGQTPLIDENGREFQLKELLDKPLVLVLAYYTCDGSCSIINAELDSLMEDVKRVTPGEDFNILTLSFDKNDNAKTAQTFRNKLELTRDYGGAWHFASFKNRDDLKAQTKKIGFKFFWSAQDRLFLHPGAFLFLSDKGRLIRILYPPNAGSADIELAVLDAKQGQFRPQEIINFAVSLCYSYNFAEGKYTWNIPLFVGIGALLTGISLLVGSITLFKRKLKTKKTDSGENSDEQIA